MLVVDPEPATQLRGEENESDTDATWQMAVLDVDGRRVDTGRTGRGGGEQGSHQEIVENDWTGNLVDIRLSKIILEEEMGYEVDLVFTDYLAQWVALAQGDLHVAMEVWPSYVRPQMEEHIAEFGGSGEVTNLGHLGVSGRPGYYIFDYMLHGDAERGIEACCPDLTDWSKLNQYKDAFKTPESGDQGRWVGAPVAAWAAHDEERLANLDLDFQHVGLGSDVALLSEIRVVPCKG